MYAHTHVCTLTRVVPLRRAVKDVGPGTGCLKLAWCVLLIIDVFPFLLRDRVAGTCAILARRGHGATSLVVVLDAMPQTQ